MSNGRDNPQEIPSQKSTSDKVEESVKLLGGDAAKMGSLIETLFGPAQPTPYTPPRIGGAPQQLAAPPGAGPGGGGGGLPQAPQGVTSAPPPRPGIMSTGTEFRTSQGKNAAVVGGAIENISGALHNISETKKQEGIQHAKFLYDLVKTSYENGDEKTANLILSDDKSRKTIEKYLTGKLPRLAGGPNGQQGGKQDAQAQGGPGGMPMPQGGPPQPSAAVAPPPGINQPGGVAMPRPSLQQQIDTALRQITLKGLQEGDPRIVSKFFGEESTLTKEQLAQATRAKYGIELAPAQLEVMGQQAKLAMAEAQVDVMKYLAGQEMISKRMMETARLHGESAENVAKINAKARTDSMSMYSKALKEIRGAPADKMEAVIYKSLADTYNHLAVSTSNAAGRLAKDNPEQSKQFEEQSKMWADKARGMEDYHDANQFYKKYIEGGEPATTEVPDMEETPPKEEPD